MERSRWFYGSQFNGLLIDSGVPVNSQNGMGVTPLQVAAANSCIRAASRVTLWCRPRLQSDDLHKAAKPQERQHGRHSDPYQPWRPGQYHKLRTENALISRGR